MMNWAIPCPHILEDNNSQDIKYAGVFIKCRIQVLQSIIKISSVACYDTEEKFQTSCFGISEEGKTLLSKMLSYGRTLL
jgi:hypothetical protein